MVAAFFAVRAAVAWQVTLPQGAKDDLRAAPDAAITATAASANSTAACGSDPAAVPADVRTAAAAGGFTTYQMVTSDSLALGSLPGLAPDSTIKAYCASSLEGHAVLAAGQWPQGASAGPGGAIPVAVPVSTMSSLKLHIGSTLTLTDALSRTQVRLVAVGAFNRALNPAGYWSWDQIGASGVQQVGSYTVYDPVVVDPAAFRSGALHAESSSVLVLPPVADGSATGLSLLSAQASAIADSLTHNSAPYYTVTGSLAADLSALSDSVVVAHAQLLAAGLLLGAVTTAGLIATAGLLVGAGAAQSALRRARGAGRRHLLAAYWAELLLLCAAAAVTVPIGTATAHATTLAAWFTAGVIGLLGATTLGLRAIRLELPGEVAAARGRQAPLAYGLRLGADLVLVGLAALALWQSSSNPLTGRVPGGLPGANLIVAAAPALAVAAGAGLAGRLVPAAARLAERGANRARRLSTVFAFWQVGRTPLNYLLPALVTIAAVAGGTFAIAQNASWQRSAQDQGSYSAGAEIAVTTPWADPARQDAAVAHATGVAAATPVERLPAPQDGSLIALDAGSADRTVLLRPDLAPVPAADLWHKLAAQSAPGLAVPGTPAQLTLKATLSAAKVQLGPAEVTATVQDAAGLTYPVAFGQLAADGQVHTLSGTLTGAGRPDYPLNLLRLDVAYFTPAAKSADATLSVSGFASQPTGGGAATPFASGNAFAGWLPSSSWNGDLDPCLPGQDGNGANTAPTLPTVDPTASGGATLHFTTGKGLNFNGNAPCEPAQADMVFSANTQDSALAAIATTAYLHSTGTSVGATVPITVNGTSIPGRIVAAMPAFPTLPTDKGGLVVDLPTLAAAVATRGSAMPPPTEWWLHTVNATVPADLPAGSTAVTAAGTVDRLAHDPLAAAAPRVLTLGAADLALLAGLSLAACLAAAGRKQSVHEPVLAALGSVSGQRTAIRLLRNLAVVAPAALLGWALGLAVSRELVPSFVLTPGGRAPVPSVLLTTRPGWSAAAVVWVLVIGVVAALNPRSPSFRALIGIGGGRRGRA
jgi:hypothetical protein